MSMQLLRSTEDMPVSSKPLWERSDLDDNELLAEFFKECQVVRRSIDGDLVKVQACRGIPEQSLGSSYIQCPCFFASVTVPFSPDSNSTQ